MKLAIIGSRAMTDYEWLCQRIQHIVNAHQYTISTIISGGAKGADMLGERYAIEYNMPCIVHQAQWQQYGRKAGIIRNQDIIHDSDIVIAFWDGISKGTKDSINKARKKGKLIHIESITNNKTH